MPGVILEPLAGCIKWLPHKDELISAEPYIEEGCCNHPVVILSTQPCNGRVEILIITSFGGLDLETKYPRQLEARLDHLPIAPNKAHPDNNILLILQDTSPKLKKHSYIKTRKIFKIRPASLQPYNRHGPEVFLSKRSYQTLVRYIQFTEPQPEPVSYSLGTSSSYSRVFRESLIEVEQSAAVDHVASLLGYRARTTGSNSTRPSHSSHLHPRSDFDTRIPRRPLPPPKGEYRPHHHDNHIIFQTTHPIQPGSGGDSPKRIYWVKFRKAVKIEEALESIGEKTKGLWASLRKKLGL